MRGVERKIGEPLKEGYVESAASAMGSGRKLVIIADEGKGGSRGIRSWRCHNRKGYEKLRFRGLSGFVNEEGPPVERNPPVGGALLADTRV